MDTLDYTVNCSILLTELPLLQRPQAARDAGFDAVEFWWPFAEPVPADREVDEFVRAVEDAGVQLTGLNFAAGDMPAGDRGLLSDPAAYRYLPRSVAYLPPAADMLAMLRRSGFADATHAELSGGITQLLGGTRDR